VTGLLAWAVSLLRAMGCDCDADLVVHRSPAGVTIDVDHEHACRLLACMDRRN